jgi:pyruvate/2-oxoglutarate dehydrogenase complex dihydrolipoamide acyltransferase (E2) component
VLYRLIVPGTLEDVQEVRVLEWHGEPGARFAPGDLIVELETHKAVIEVRAEQPGTLRQRFADEGAWCRLEGLLAVLSDDPAEPVPASAEDLGIISARFSIG